jgi:GNAT superfamily N-acetyltransferase
LRAEENMLCSVRCYASAAGGEVIERGPIICMTTPVSMRSFNQVFVLEPLADATVLLESLAGFQQAGRRCRLRVRDDIGLADDIVAAAGLTLRGGIPSMALTPVESQDTSTADLDIRPATDEATLADHVSIVASAFDWAREELARVFTSRLLADDAWSAFVGYVGGEPVSTTQLVVTGDTGGLYYVGTLESHRGKGYGALLTRRAVGEAAARGCTLVSLQASPLGRPVYERVGFRRVADYLTFVRVD